MDRSALIEVLVLARIKQREICKLNCMLDGDTEHLAWCLGYADSVAKIESWLRLNKDVAF